jgi:methylase of polypeptide subunit release factors
MKLEHAPVPALRPSEYSAALIQVLQWNSQRIKGASVVDVGSGSGIVLASLAVMGARLLCGVDIEQAAVDVGTKLMRELGHAGRSEFLKGDMWAPLGERRFDVVAANLPHFPMEAVEVAGRLPTWSAGGTDGRKLLDRFLDGLPRHLAPNGKAVITHNGFVGVERTREIVGRAGLGLRIAKTEWIYIADEKLDLMTDSVLLAEDGRSIHRYGPYTFGEMHIVEIGAPGALG